MPVETREHRELKFTPQTPDDPTELPLTFRLDIWLTPQRRDGRSSTWLATGSPQVMRLADGLTRPELAALITDAADILAYPGDD